MALRNPKILWKLEEEIVHEIVQDLKGRKSLGDLWGEIEPSTRREIKQTWERLTADLIDRASTEGRSSG